MPGTRYQLEVNPKVPARLARLDELANNLWYSWDRPTRSLFARLSAGLWRATRHSPKAFLKRIDQKRINEAGDDPVFLGTMNRVLSAFDSYHAEPTLQLPGKPPLQATDLIAYFCAEFGFHESLPIYSGGLGILAGDHCKGASDLRLPFVAVGLLYRQGYFHQTIDRDGNQTAHYGDNDFDDMPIEPVRRVDGSEVRVGVDFPGRMVWAKVWRARVGINSLYLLDTQLAENSEADRGIAHQLYGGDRRTRIEQEILLGVGGVRALNALELQPTVWHINEGHAAFQVLERVRNLVEQNMSFAAALEAAAANTVFTTHTPVPAGHDHFADDMVMHYFGEFCKATGLDRDGLLGMGRVGSGGGEFNMTALALRGSRFHNGVSRIHGEVSSRICSDLWPQVTAAENPMDFVTNAVHVPTFLATDWYETFDRHLGLGWQHRLTDQSCWDNVQRIPDQIFWSIRQSLKAQLLHLVHSRVRQQHLRNQGSEAHLDRVLRSADPTNPTVLTIGFARRFATYKRAALLFNNLDWLREILSDAKHPVLFIFAGKAHPADEPGRRLVRQIAELSQQREFEGRILLVEGYDLHLARRMVAGVDVWLNNPIYPLEASGTSGMKAAINGAINLSVLDGWWGEGYDGKNGWAIKPAAEGLDPAQRDADEARTLYELLQDSVIPMYYRNTSLGYSPEWVAMAKQSIASIMPRFNMQRMLTDYAEKFYSPAAEQWRRYASADFSGARRVADWKARIRAAWPRIGLRRIDQTAARIRYGETLRFEIAVQLDGLTPDDLTVELVFTRPGEPTSARARRYELSHERPLERGEHLFSRELTPDQCGKMEYRVRVFPTHELLTHPFEMGMMLWL